MLFYVCLWIQLWFLVYETILSVIDWLTHYWFYKCSSFEFSGALTSMVRSHLWWEVPSHLFYCYMSSSFHSSALGWHYCPPVLLALSVLLNLANTSPLFLPAFCKILKNIIPLSLEFSTALNSSNCLITCSVHNGEGF